MTKLQEAVERAAARHRRLPPPAMRRLLRVRAQLTQSELAEVLENAQVAHEEAVEEAGRLPRGSARRERAERRVTDLEGRVAELAEEARLRSVDAGSAALRQGLIERHAREIVANEERRRVAKLKQDRAPQWQVEKAIEEAGDRDRLARLIEKKKLELAPRLDQDHRRKMGSLLDLGAGA